MKKKIFCLAQIALLLAFSFSAQAQQQTKIPRIGFLGDAPAHGLEAFRQRLRDLGWIESRNIAIEYRPHLGRRDKLPGLAAELISLNVDVIVAAGTSMALASQQASRTIPIVMAASSDPVAAGLIASLARPGGNVTGLSNVNVELSGKRLELLKETFPRITRVAVLWRPAGPGNEQQMKEVENAAHSLGVQLQRVGALEPNDFEEAFMNMKRERASALITLSGPFFNVHRARIVELATTSRLPAIYPEAEFVEAGGLMAYGLSATDSYRRAATYVDKILKGARPADLPVEQPTKFELVINLKAAKQLGLTIPPNVLARADRVIR